MARDVLPAAVQHALTRGADVLLASGRAAHALRAACDDPEAGIHALDEWLRQLWTKMTVSGQVSRMLLNRAQELVLWRQAVGEDAEVSALRSVDSLAELAVSAYRTLLLYEGRAELAEHAQTTDSRAFLRWTEAFEQRLRRQGACTAAQLPGLMAGPLGCGELPVGDAGLLLVDFDTLPPAWSNLFDQLKRAGFPIHALQTANPDPEPLLFAAEDTAGEYEEAARWLRARLDRDPQARLALLMTNQEEARPALERVLCRVLTPEQAGLGVGRRPWEFSLGSPLAETSEVTAAFGLLRLAGSPQGVSDVGGLLLSPSFGAAGPLAEAFAVAEFEAQEVRRARRLRPQVSLEALLRMASRSLFAARMPGLVGRLQAMAEAAVAANLRTPAARQTHARWADAFRALLSAAGWTGTGGRSSRSFQVHARWESALDELSTLDFDGSRPTAAEALTALTEIAHGTVFAPESQDAPVQVVGPLEPGGVPFDGMWVLGAGDLSWPTAPAPNPLLPRALLRLLGVPGASPADDHERAQTLVRRIAGSAGECVVSFARLADREHQRPSPVLAGMRMTEWTGAPAPEPEPPLAMSEVPDLASRVALPDEVIRGGAAILEQQAACAFRAFAQYRLGSTELARQADGFDQGERGSLVHAAMQFFWEGLADQRELKQLSLEEREEFLNECIERALEATMRAAESPWDRAYLHTQHVRLGNLLHPWIEAELQRPPFAVRVSEKTLEDARLGPLRMKLRVDRIDETEAGELILDYKTGNAEPGEWLSERPDKPQLPLYAVLASEPVAGVAFALLRPGKGLALRGFADSGELFGGKPARMDEETFAGQLTRWKEVLTALAQEFHDGHAEVRPKDFPKTCRYCAHRILCRVDAALLGDDAGEDEEPGKEQVHG